MFLNPNIFFDWNSYCSYLLDMRNLQKQVKKHSVAKNRSDLSLFEEIALVISKIQPRIFKSFSRSLKQFFLTVGQNNFGIKICTKTLPSTLATVQVNFGARVTFD